MRVQFYPIDAVARNVGGRTAAVLYGRTISGERICVMDTNYAPYFYVVPKHGSTEELEKWISELRLREKDTDYFVLKIESKTMKLHDKETNVFKVYTNNAFSYYLVNEIRKRSEVIGIYEYDLPFLQSYLLDKRLVPGFLTEAEGDFIIKNSRVPVFSAATIEQPYDELIKPKVLAFDVETYSPKGSSSPEHDPVIMISFYSENFKKTITWKKFETEDKSIEFVDSEFELLNRFKRTIDEFKPDYLVGYTSDLFVFPYLKKRADKYGLFFDIGIDKSNADIGRGETSITGIAQIDLYKFISKIMGPNLETDSYRLKDVAQELLGETKKQIDIERLEDVWDNEPSKLAPYCEYNLHDAYLIYKLYEKSKPMMEELIKMTNMFPYDVARGNFTEYAESFLIKESKFANELIPFRPSSGDYESRKYFSSSDELVAAEQGIYNNIFVYDFTLLFPSIIATHNISPGTYDCWCCDEKIPGEKMHFCKKVTGFFTRVASAMLDRRKRIVKMLADETEKTKEQTSILSARENVLTNISHSLYGAFAYPSSRWHDENCTTAILAHAKNYMVSIMNKATEAGFKILYADFDSIFLRKGVHSVKLSESLYETIVASLPEKMELNHEGIYPRAMFVSSKQGKSMKRFALLNQQGVLKMQGFDSSRRNLSTIAKETQEKLLYDLLKEKNAVSAVNHVKQVIDDLKNGKIPLRKTIIYTQLQKDLSKYETNAPHVAVAKNMQKQGFPVNPGLIIKYVVGKGEGNIGDRAKLPNEIDSYDSEYYIENQIIPAVDKIFEAAGIDFVKATTEKEQVSLKEFI